MIGTQSRAALRRETRRSVFFDFPAPAGASPPRRAPPSRALLSLREAGDLPFGEAGEPARRRFFSEHGVGGDRVRGLALAHSRRVLIGRGWMSSEEVGRRAAAMGGADGLIFFDAGLVATVTVADCMPIWIRDADSGAFGVLHSGWKGTGILAEAVRSLVELCGSRPAAMSAIFGPAIGRCCYAVDEARAAAFAGEFGEGAVDRTAGAPRLDLRAANLALASSLGLGAVLSIDACTVCDDRLGSFRREGAAGFTRMVAACGCFPEGAAG